MAIIEGNSIKNLLSLFIPGILKGAAFSINERQLLSSSSDPDDWSNFKLAIEPSLSTHIE